MDRSEFVAAALAAAGEGATFAPVQVQKLFFLIDREAAANVGGPYFTFAAYDYGPFDRGVYSALDMLHLVGWVNIDSSGRYRRYSLTPEGFRTGRQALARLSADTQRFLRETAAWVRGLNFQQLVAAIYQKYPDMKANSIFRS